LVVSCGDDTASETTTSARPHEPFVFRSVLDKNPRMITFALSDEIWAAYSTQDCAIYKAWQGNVNFEGTVWTDTHGPQPTTIGNAYMENEITDVWKITDAAGNALDTKVQYKGHKYIGDGALMMYELSAQGLQNPIKITEQPEASISEANQPIFQRTFTTADVPAGHTVHFRFNTNSIIVKNNIDTDGQLTVNEEKEFKSGRISAIALDGTIALNSNATTKFNTTFLPNPLLINPLNMGTEEEDITEGEIVHPGARLINKSDCKTCHNKKVKTIGPAYLSIAKKYKTTDDNVKMLAAKVKSGGTGVWGNQIMNAHPDISDSDLKKMVSYILSLDADDEARSGVAPEVAVKKQSLAPITDIKSSDLIPGCVTAIYPYRGLGSKIPSIKGRKATMAGVMPNFDNINGSDFAKLKDDFVMVANGYLDIEKAQNYAFRLWSDDGSVLYINDEKFVDNDGMHGVEYKENMAFFEAGVYKFRIEYMQGGGGKFFSFNWKGDDADAWAVVPRRNIGHLKSQQAVIGNKTLPMANLVKIPGDQSSLEGVHPAFTLTQARSDIFTPKVGGIDFLSDGRMVVSTWDPNGSVFIVENHASGDPDQIKHKVIAQGLAEPLGLKVMNDRIFVMQKQEITELVDTNGDDTIDEYRTLSNDWDVSANFHEFGFGLEGRDGHLYAALATAIEPGGASTQPQIKDRGKVIKVDINTGELEFVASGLRTPNGVGIGHGGSIYIADNQGDWLPSSKIVEVKEGRFFGQRSVDFAGTANLEVTPPVVWLPQDEIGNSPSTPLTLNVGPYKNQMIHGEVTNGGIKRVFVEEIDGVKQGALFRFTQGMEAGVNRLRWAPDGSLYIGGIGAPGNWQANQGLKWYGLQRMEYNGKTAFEMLAVRAKSNGMEIEFTEALEEGDGWLPNSYQVEQWYYKATKEYGGPKLGLQDLRVKSASVSDDRKKIFLEIDGLKDDHVVYIRLKDKFISSTGQSLWSPECWYTMNNVPKGNPGTVQKAPASIGGINQLSALEKEQGWSLLFDGKDISEFRNFKKETVGSSWIIDDQAIHLKSEPRGDGSWQAKDGGDLVSDKEYQDFDLKLEWKISNCGNSGIIFNSVESDEYDYVWQTGPEMQILDNSCHPDTKYEKHRAGDLYDLIATKYVTVNPAGEWNKIRIISKGGKVQFYQNGYEVVNFEMHNDKWAEMIENSKFNHKNDKMHGFGLAKKGHICLQDHGDKVWFRNIKIREL